MLVVQRKIKREIKKVGKGVPIPLQKADPDDLGARIGSTVNVTASSDDGNYIRTRTSSTKMRQRYARTLKILGQ